MNYKNSRKSSKDNINVCINAANLHFGGGVQVGTSFLEELVSLQNSIDDLTITILVSSEINSNLSSRMHELKSRYNVLTVDLFGIQVLKPSWRRFFSEFDVVFTIFGPDYLPFLDTKRIVGFAQSWILYSDSEAYSQLTLLRRLRKRFSFYVKKLFFKGAHSYIVELEHVKKQMIIKNIGSESNIHIVHNAIAGIYRTQDVKQSLIDKIVLEPFTLGIISRNYSHKNLSIIPRVKKILERKYGRKVKFFVTFTEAEFLSQSSEFQTEVINIGPKNVDECVTAYNMFDAVFFPSLLESFSATPLESLATGNALFASDRPFNRDVAGDFAYYFDPLDAEDAASVINEYIEKSWGHDIHKRLQGRSHALDFSSPRVRALKYIEIIRKCAFQRV